MNKEILILAHFDGLKTRPDKLDYNFFEYLSKNSNYKIHMCLPNDENIKNILKNENVIIIVFTCMPDYLKSYSNKKIYWIYDFWCNCCYKCNGTSKKCKFKPQRDYIIDNNFDYIWYKYETYITIELKNAFPNKLYKFPHMIFNPEIHKDNNLDKKYDILFYGATYPDIYPFRNRLYYLLKSNENKFNILFLPYTKKNAHKMITGKELNEKINQSWLTIACCLIQNILVAKYFEIGLCGSVVCGDYPELEDETFIKNNMIYIDIKMSDEEIITKITNALNNKEKLIEYSYNTKKYLSENYMYKNGLELFEKYIRIIEN